jgi:hypothetical protein
MQELDHPVRRGSARLSAVPVEEGGRATARDEHAPVVPAHRLLDVAAALSDGASRMHARLRHLDPRDRDEVLELVASQVSEIVGLWTDLVRDVVSTDDPVVVPGDGPGMSESGLVDEGPVEGAIDHATDTGPVVGGHDPDARWRAEGSAAPERWETADGPDGARRDGARHEIERLTRDELTGVLNRQAGLAALGREVDRCRRDN